MAELTQPYCPKDLVEAKTDLFGNIEHIYMFHDVQFLTDLRDCEKSPRDVADCFLKHVSCGGSERKWSRSEGNGNKMAVT